MWQAQRCRKFLWLRRQCQQSYEFSTKHFSGTGSIAGLSGTSTTDSSGETRQHLQLLSSEAILVRVDGVLNAVVPLGWKRAAPSIEEEL